MLIIKNGRKPMPCLGFGGGSMKKNYTASKTKKKQHEWFNPDGSFRAISVELAAKKMVVSERRVRKMLSDGVLSGTKESRAWLVDYPFRIRIGTRGPASQAFKDRSFVPKGRHRRNSKPFDNSIIKKGD